MADGASYAGMMNTAQENFGYRLRSRRERLGISLEAIAASTKIKRSLLADLERGDVSKWPQGIYRRAYVRDYAAAIGLSADVVDEFLERFPGEGARSAAPSRRTEPAGELRLKFADDPNQARIRTARRLLVAMLELCAVLGVGWIVAAVTGSKFWTVSGMIALTYYPIAAACSDRVLTFRWPAIKPLFSGLSRHYAIPSSRELIQLFLHRPPVRRADERIV